MQSCLREHVRPVLGTLACLGLCWVIPTDADQACWALQRTTAVPSAPVQLAVQQGHSGVYGLRCCGAAMASWCSRIQPVWLWLPQFQ